MGTRRRNSSEWASSLGHAVAGQLAVGQLLGVLGAARGVGLAVEDHVEGHAHRLLGRQVAEGHGGRESVEGTGRPAASIPWLARHHCGPDAKRSGPVTPRE